MINHLLTDVTFNLSTDVANMARCTGTLVLTTGFMFLVLIGGGQPARKKNPGTDLIVKVADLKEYKKLLKTRTNVLMVFAKNERSFNSQLNLFGEAAEAMKGLATIAWVDCGEKEAKKACKKLKVSPTKIDIKHFNKGEFNKDYDRLMTLKSMTNFLRDPTGDIPWEEDATANDVVHLDTPKALSKLLKQERKPILAMFYAPWCGFCKRMKPDYAAAATELKDDYVLAGMDVDRQENAPVRAEYNITGFPTLYYFENGKKKFQYGGENDKEGIIKWMKNPAPPQEKPKEEEWADVESDVVHLTDDSFDEYMSTHPSVLVMFYAPWCGHCKKMKPEYQDAATKLKEEEVPGFVAAVDATKEKKLGDRFKIKGFPTVKYFKDGEEQFDFNERTADKIVSFMKDPKEPPPPPPPEPSWEETPSEVVHLKDDTFKSTLKKKKHTLVMFYAPWCGHCKKAKPEFMAAAKKFKDDLKVVFGAVDCTTERSTCQAHDVTGYPTFVYFNYGKDGQKYAGGREEADFVKFMKDPQNPSASLPPPPPSPEEQWKDADPSSNIQHLTAVNFDSYMAEQSSVLVMFYAPWCGHCRAMKPAYGNAAAQLKEMNIDGVLAAVDATAEATLAQKYGIKGYPTIKYFKNGVEEFEYDRGRSTEDLVDFMQNPVQKAKAPEPPKEPSWADQPGAVTHLAESSFSSQLKDKPDALVMFYAPWCGHCKAAKPAFQAAFDEVKGTNDRFYAAVDCTSNQDLCQQENADAYPTFRHYKKGKFFKDFNSGRSKEDFLAFNTASGKTKEEL